MRLQVRFFNIPIIPLNKFSLLVSLKRIGVYTIFAILLLIEKDKRDLLR